MITLDIDDTVENADWIKQMEARRLAGKGEPQYEKVQKYNPNHDPKNGQFTSSNLMNTAMDKALRGKYVKPVDVNAEAHRNLVLLRVNGIEEGEPVDSMLDKLDAIYPQPRLAFVHDVGKVMQVEHVPDDKLMTPHRCYNNSIDVMIESMHTTNQAQYVEGVVTEHGVPLAHAWNKVGDKYVDHTIGEGNHQYMGLVIPRKVLIPVASSGLFGKGVGEGIIGTILNMKQTKKRDEYLRLIKEANQ